MSTDKKITQVNSNGSLAYTTLKRVSIGADSGIGFTPDA
jgi:hypothetical protein